MDTGNEFADEAKIFESISSDKHATQEEFDNFMHRVTDVGEHLKIYFLKNNNYAKIFKIYYFYYFYKHFFIVLVDSSLV